MSSLRLRWIALRVPLAAALAAPVLSCPAPRDKSSMSESGRDTLGLELEVPAEVPLGSPVPVVIRIRNLTDRALSLHLLGTEIVYDLVVSREDGTPVWQRLEGKSIPMILRIVTIGPRRTLELKGSWNQRTSAGVPVDPGSYRMQGLLPTDEAPLRTPTKSFRINPR
jgi:intracellular proteinase inhibitor BsuPI